MIIKQIVVHHSASLASGDQFDAINTFHKNKDWGGGAKAPKSSLGHFVQYHYLIEPSGIVKQAAKDSEIRWHAGYVNAYSLGICLSGDFDRQMPTEAQVKSLTDLLVKKVDEHNIPASSIYPHRKFASKSCYGKNLSDVWASNLLRGYLMAKIAELNSLIKLLMSKVAKSIQK